MALGAAVGSVDNLLSVVSRRDIHVANARITTRGHREVNGPHC